MMKIALLLSGGTGTRMGEKIPKQYLKVAGKPIITYCLDRLFSSPQIDAVQIVASKEWQMYILDSMKERDYKCKFHAFTLPGETRQMSIFHGLDDIKKYAGSNSTVLICDAARPLLTEQLISDCYAALDGCDGVIPVLPMKDTVYSSKDGKTIGGLLHREEIYAGQAPELFDLKKYYEANRRLPPDAIKKMNGSTEPAILAGMKITMIPGDENNFKITTPTDLKRFRSIVEGTGQ